MCCIVANMVANIVANIVANNIVAAPNHTTLVRRCDIPKNRFQPCAFFAKGVGN